MTDNTRRPALRGTTLDPETAQAYTELLVRTIRFLDAQIEHTQGLPGADPARHFLRAIEAHIEAKLETSLQLQGGQL